jgi:predicted nucleic acid-binding protein
MLRVLLDTSFLLPSFGVDVGEEVYECLEFISARRDRVRVCYSPYSLLEAVLVLLREVRQGRLRLGDAVEIIKEGAANVIYGLEASEIAPEAFSLAIELYDMGLRDIFDALLYSTAATSGMTFLTLDRGLAEFVEKRGLPRVVVGPKKLKEFLV